MSQPKSYVRSSDGATMVEVEPHQYVNAKILQLQGRSAGGKVTAQELAAGRSELERWQTPAAFIAKVKELGERVKSDKLFNLTTVKFLLDAMVLAEFVKFRPTEMVRLVEQRAEWPDGQIGTRKNPANIEITEAMEVGRKRGDEYRNPQQPQDVTAEDLHRRAKAIPEQLEKAIQQKADKGYSHKCVLVVYLNIVNHGVLQKESEAGIANVKAKYANDFQGICVLWQGKLF